MHTVFDEKLAIRNLCQCGDGQHYLRQCVTDCNVLEHSATCEADTFITSSPPPGGLQSSHLHLVACNHPTSTWWLAIIPPPPGGLQSSHLHLVAGNHPTSTWWPAIVPPPPGGLQSSHLHLGACNHLTLHLGACNHSTSICWPAII